MFSSNQRLCINGTNNNRDELRQALDFAIKRYSFSGNGDTANRTICVAGIYYNINKRYILLKSYIPYNPDLYKENIEGKEETIKIPVFMDYKEAINFIESIVYSVLERMEYNRMPMIDGSVEKGWVLNIPAHFLVKKHFQMETLI